MSDKYHINPETGNANKCTARYNCKFNISDEKHYENKEEAKQGAEWDLKGEYITEDESFALVKSFEKTSSRVDSDGMDFDGVSYNIGYIKKGLSEDFEGLQKAGTLKDLVRAAKVAEILDKENPTEEDFAEAQRIRNQIKKTYDSDRWGKSNFNKAENRIESFAENLIKVRKLENIPEPEAAPERPNIKELRGLREAELIAVRTGNMYDTIGDSAVDNFDKTMNRIVNGEDPEDLHDGEGTYLQPKHDRLMYNMAEQSNLYLATAWAEEHLAPTMKKNGIKDVEVSSFYNSREWGNVYTVTKPNGEKMSFSVYEHRNSDSIIINGKSNWDGEELPYVADSKNQFFAELAHDEKGKAADVLTFFMKETQSGQIKDEVTLANNAMRRDWMNILDNQIPGFGDWAKKNGYESNKAETDKDILGGLDFDV